MRISALSAWVCAASSAVSVGCASPSDPCAALRYETMMAQQAGGETRDEALFWVSHWILGGRAGGAVPGYNPRFEAQCVRELAPKWAALFGSPDGHWGVDHLLRITGSHRDPLVARALARGFVEAAVENPRHYCTYELPELWNLERASKDPLVWYSVAFAWKSGPGIVDHIARVGADEALAQRDVGCALMRVVAYVDESDTGAWATVLEPHLPLLCSHRNASLATPNDRADGESFDWVLARLGLTCSAEFLPDQWDFPEARP